MDVDITEELQIYDLQDEIDALSEEIIQLQYQIEERDKKISELTKKLKKAELNSIENYEYWTGIKWQIVSPRTLVMRRKDEIK